MPLKVLLKQGYPLVERKFFNKVERIGGQDEYKIATSNHGYAQMKGKQASCRTYCTEIETGNTEVL